MSYYILLVANGAITTMVGISIVVALQQVISWFLGSVP